MSKLSNTAWRTLEKVFSRKRLPFEEARKRIFSGAYSVVIGVVLLIFVPDHLSKGLIPIAVVSVLGAVFLFGAVVNARDKTEAPYHYLMSPIVCGVLFLVLAFNGEPNRFALLWLYTYIPAVIFLLGIRRGTLISLGVSAVWIVSLLTASGEITSEFYTTAFVSRFAMTIAVFIGISCYFEWVRSLYAANVNKEQQELENDRRHMHHLAFSDELTKLPNRRSAVHFLDDTIAALSYDQSRVALVGVLDIDRFKVINDQFGHQVGDRVLVEVARRIRLAIRADDFVGRYGGEEFLIIVPSTSSDRFDDILEKIRWAICHRPIEVDDVLHHVTASIGASSTTGQLTHKEVIERADQALYTAKQSGRNRSILYSEDDLEIEHEHITTIAS